MGSVLGIGAGIARELRPRTWAEIDLDAFDCNVRRAARLAPRGRVLAVLKADAYGHGAAVLGHAAHEAGAALLGVGDSTEAIELRRGGVAAPILVLGALVSSEIPAMVGEDIRVVVHSMGRVEELEDEAQRQGRTVKVHLKVDTGMGRLGMLPERAMEVARRIADSRHLELEGLMSHLAGGGEIGRASNHRQASVFAEVITACAALGLRPPEIHLRNTAGLLVGSLDVPGETLARAGAFLYGFSPSGHGPPEGCIPVLSLRTQIVFIKDVKAETPVGYGGSFQTRRPTRLATLPLGYHDGMLRGLANRGQALVRGRRVPVVGQVSMDYTTLDITDVPGVGIGDTVTLIGVDGDDRITVEEVAERAGTIPYDVLCRLGRRVVRIPHRPSGAPPRTVPPSAHA